jgi:hypothetical protein
MCGRDDDTSMIDAPLKRRVDAIHDALVAGRTGCHHPRHGESKPTCEQVDQAIGDPDEADPCKCGHSRYEHPSPCSVSECGCSAFRTSDEVVR